jgi:hypothetical protein
MSENQDQGSQNESLVAALVGEGKKYASLEELAKSRIEADSFIDTLKEENANLRSETQTQTTIKDVMDAIKSSQKDSDISSDPLSDEDLQRKIVETIELRDGERTRNSNRAEAKKLVLDRLDGDESALDAFINEKARSLGMSADTLWSLSEESPSGFANLVGVGNRKQESPGSPGSLPHINTDSLGLGSSTEIDGHKTKKWYDEQRKAMGGRKFINDKKMQLGMLRDAAELGDKFYS